MNQSFKKNTVSWTSRWFFWRTWAKTQKDLWCGYRWISLCDIFLFNLHSHLEHRIVWKACGFCQKLFKANPSPWPPLSIPLSMKWSFESSLSILEMLLLKGLKKKQMLLFDLPAHLRRRKWQRVHPHLRWSPAALPLPSQNTSSTLKVQKNEFWVKCQI